MGKITVELKGADKLVTKFENMSRQMAKEVKKSVKKHTYGFETKAKKDSPYRTGHMKRSIHSDFYNGGLSGETTIGANYAVYVILGTRYQAAQSAFWFGNFMITKAAFIKDLNRIKKDVVD